MKKTGGTEQSAYPGWSQHEIGGEIYREPTPGLTKREPTPGLTKREAFAMAAMQGLMANEESVVLRASSGRLSCMAVEMADALLAELAK